MKRIFDKWDLPWAEIGVVTDTGRMVVRHHGEVVVDIPARKLADEAPVYHREAREPAYLKAVRAFRLAAMPDTPDPIATPEGSARLADHRLEELGLSPIRSHGARRLGRLPRQRRRGASASRTIRCRSCARRRCKRGTELDSGEIHRHHRRLQRGYVYLDPYEGGKIAVAEAAATSPAPARCRWASPTI